jgi:hypothetical protein
MKRVGVLRGGNENYEASLKEGGDFISYVLENLSERWKPIDLLIDKDGLWHMSGRPIVPADLSHHVDVVWNTAGASSSRTLEDFSIPHVSKSLFSSSLESSREMLRTHIQNTGVLMPRSIILPLYLEDLDGPRPEYAMRKAGEILKKFPGPWMVKSLVPNSDMAIHVAKSFPDLADAIEDGVSHGESILVEELITGNNTTIHTMPGFRGEDVYHMSADKLSSAQRELAGNLAQDLHTHLGAKHYLKSEFILNPQGKVYLANIDFSPDLKADSHFCQSCESVGAKAHHVIEHILEQALQ